MPLRSLHTFCMQCAVLGPASAPALRITFVSFFKFCEEEKSDVM